VILFFYQISLKEKNVMKTVTVVINEQHTLLPNQEEVMRKEHPIATWKELKVPAEGWNLQEMKGICKALTGHIIMVSPIPYMIKNLTAQVVDNEAQALLFHFGVNHNMHTKGNIDGVQIMCNDTREKVELPNGKIIHKVAATGWYLV
jgi:hypothetical protein